MLEINEASKPMPVLLKQNNHASLECVSHFLSVCIDKQKEIFLKGTCTLFRIFRCC